MKVAVVAEFYPRAEDPVLGVWAHRQAVAARDAGADVRVFVLQRVVPAMADVSSGAGLRSLGAKLRQPRHAELDGIPVEYVKFASPPRSRTYGSWGAWAAPALRLAWRGRSFDLVHAHNAVPAGEAVRRSLSALSAGPSGARTASVRKRPPSGLPHEGRSLARGASAGSGLPPVVVSVHGGDVFFTARRWPAPVRRALSEASLVLANSAGVAELSRKDGAGEVRVVRLGTDIPAEVVRGDGRTVVTVGHLVARKRHDDVIRALPPGARYEIVGDGPERPRLEALAREHGAEVVFHGQLPHAEALAVARRCDVFAMPSTDEAFGVAYVEAMAGGLPAIGRKGEPGPDEIAALGGGMLLSGGDDLRHTIGRALADRDALGDAARATVREHFTWERTGAATVAAYEDALR